MNSILLEKKGIRRNNHKDQKMVKVNKRKKIRKKNHKKTKRNSLIHLKDKKLVDLTCFKYWLKVL